MSEINLPQPLLDEIAEQADRFYQGQIKQASKFYADNELFVWRPDEPVPPVPKPNGADKYHGAVADEYDARREQTPKHIWEQGVIEDMLSDLSPGSWVLDCPAGTGRFFEFYARHGLHFHAVDKSEDMLRKAAKKLKGLKGKSHVQFAVADVRTLTMPRDWVEAAVMCRLTRWLETKEDNQAAIRNLQRIAKKRIVFTLREKHGKRPELSRPLAWFEEVLQTGWRVARVEKWPEDEQYRVVMLEAA